MNAQREIEVRQAEELVRLGGNFYTVDDALYFDSYSATWQYVSALGGFVRLDSEGRLPVRRSERTAALAR